MTDPNPLERALLAAALFGGGEPKTIDVDSADIRLSDGTGHLLTHATITGAWDTSDVMTGRCE